MLDDYQDWDECDLCGEPFVIEALIFKRTQEKHCIKCETEEERLWAIRLSEAEHVA